MPEINDPSFNLFAFGLPRLVIESDGAPVGEFGPGKGVAILTYLALSPSRSTTRDQLCELLWGDRELAAARPQLRQTLWLIKTQMHNGLITTAKDFVRISDEARIDAAEFLTAIGAGDFERAVDLYRGDFFVGFASRGSARFEDWAALERTRFRRLFVNAAEALMRVALDSGQFARALKMAERVRDAEPQGQTGWRFLLEARLASGDVLGARAEADKFEAWLDQEEWEPEPASREILREVRSSENTPSSSAHEGEIVAELVGRSCEFAMLHSSWIEAKSRGARIVHITAPSGMGKTRLIRDFISRVKAEGGRARYIRANHGERAIPFSFASAVANALANAPGARGISPESANLLVTLSPSLSTVFTTERGRDRPLDSRDVGLSLLELCQAIADEEPIAVLLDDMHWVDSSSRDALTIVASRLRSENLLLVTTARPQNRAVHLEAHSKELVLEPLNADEVAQLVTSLGALPDECWTQDLVSSLVSVTRGNPLAVLGTLRYCLDNNLITLLAGHWVCSHPDKLIDELSSAADSHGAIAGLTSHERQILLLLAAAGVPLPVPIVAAAVHRDSIAGERLVDLGQLDQKGLLIVGDGELSPAHDSIVEQVLRSSPAEALEDADLLLGRAMSSHANQWWQRRSIVHFVNGGHLDAAAQVAGPFVRRRHRSVTADEELALLTGNAVSPQVRKDLLRKLPLRVRRPRMVRHMALAAGVATAALTFAAAGMWRSDPTESETTLVLMSGSTAQPRRIVSAALSLGDWDTRKPIFRSQAQRSVRSPYITQGHVVARPGHESWVENVTFPDSGDGEVVLFSMGAKPRRLTFARGDDRPVGFSPDGRYLLFLTTRWSDKGWSDLTILDLTTGSLRRLTHEAARFGGAAWSPDGSRIAAVTTVGESGVPTLCIFSFAGKSSCRVLELIGTALAGWTDIDHVVIGTDPVKRVWSVMNVRSGEIVRTFLRDEETVQIDPTGRWVLLGGRPSGGARDRILPVGRPDAPRRISDDTSFRAFPIITGRASSIYVDSVAISAMPRRLPVRVPHQLRVSAWTANKRAAAVGLTEWRSLTPAIAVVDTNGVLIGLKNGVALVEASIGGWRTATARIPIEDIPSAVRLDERWNGDVWNRWRRFGVPESELIGVGSASSLVINGDDDYFSGVYLKQSMDARNGLAIDLEVSTRITRTQWQTILATIAPLTNPAALDRWDHKTGYISQFFPLAGCAFTFPHGEGPNAISGIRWLPGLLAAKRDSSFQLQDGRWYRVRVQLFPDGRCGIAVDGHALVIEHQTVDVFRPMLMVVQGNSVDTRLLVRRVTVRSSVPPGVNWDRLVWDGKEWSNSVVINSP